MPEKKAKELGVKDVLKKIAEDPDIHSTVLEAAKDMFNLARGGDPNAKYASWNELDKAYTKIKATNEVMAVAQVFANVALNAIVMNWKKIQSMKP